MKSRFLCTAHQKILVRLCFFLMTARFILMQVFGSNTGSVSKNSPKLFQIFNEKHRRFRQGQFRSVSLADRWNQYDEIHVFKIFTSIGGETQCSREYWGSKWGYEEVFRGSQLFVADVNVVKEVLKLHFIVKRLIGMYERGISRK